jgi:hypothetical protein
MKWIPHRHDGDQTPIIVIKFKHWIGTQQHWFCVHESLEFIGRYTVSDWASGYRVMDIEYMTMVAARGDLKAAARNSLNKLIERAGESRVLEVLRKAPERNKNFPNAVAAATI